MKKSTTKVAMVVIILVTVLVGYYAYLSNRVKTNQSEAVMTAVQDALSRNLETDYPKTVKEVLTYYNKLIRCFYNESCTDEEIEALGMQARGLYDAELLEANEESLYLVRLYADIHTFQDKQRKITNIALAGSTSVDYFEEDGYHFARIQCTYNVSEGGITTATVERYLLRQDENKRWKIYGWELVPNSN